LAIAGCIDWQLSTSFALTSCWLGFIVAFPTSLPISNACCDQDTDNAKCGQYLFPQFFP
jgi:hypothetical protein